MTDLVRTTTTRHVAAIALNRPDVHNALHVDLIKAVTAAVSTAGKDPTVRVIVIRGEGKSFCAGADIRWMQESINAPPDRNYAEALAFADMLHAIRLAPKPVLARVHGAAFGGGVGIVAACDLACAVNGAKFSLSEVRIGLLPSIISPFCIERMGMSAYRRYALTAEVFDGAEARRVGLVCDAVETVDALDAWTADITATLLKNGPAAMAKCKTEAQAVAGTPWTELRERTARAIAEIRVTPEGQEGLKAFLDKRPPNWAQ